MLMPRRTKYRRQFRGKRRGMANSGNTVSFGEWGLQAQTTAWIDARQIESARRAITAGACDAAVVGGVDSLCLTTLYGFNSLQLISTDICRPADSARLGISIGEAGGFALLDPSSESALALLG